MTIGIPKGLLYSKYHIFAEAFFELLGADIVVSPDTNKAILDAGVKYCVDDACLSIKVYHGHVFWLKDRCDYLLTPRFLSLEKGKSVCPMFCGIIEMMTSSLPGLPRLIDTPILTLDRDDILTWALKAGSVVTKNKKLIKAAFETAIEKQRTYKIEYNDTVYPKKVALIGHTYHIHDRFINMDLINKLHNLNIGIQTAESVEKDSIEEQSAQLYKPLFWYFAREYYGAAVSLYKNHDIDGIIYISAFSCGVDSVVVDLIKHETGSFPFMVLKLDEHTGEAAFDTRLEAFADMLKRRSLHGCYRSAHGQYVLSC